MLTAQANFIAMADKLDRRSPLSGPARQALLSLPHRVANLDRNSFIAREGERLPNICVLLSGFAYCSKLTGDGARQIISIHIAGDLLDLQNGIGEISTCNVQALTAVRVAYISRPAMLELAAEHLSIARALWTDIGANVSILSEWLVAMGRRCARSRISHLVCELATRQEAAGLCSGPDYPWAITQEQLGDATGLTPVHVNRTMQGLRNEGLLRTTQRQVRILDWDGLCEAGDFTRGYLQLNSGEEMVPALAG